MYRILVSNNTHSTSLHLSSRILLTHIVSSLHYQGIYDITKQASLYPSKNKSKTTTSPNKTQHGLVQSTGQEYI